MIEPHEKTTLAAPPYWDEMAYVPPLNICLEPNPWLARLALHCFTPLPSADSAGEASGHRKL